MAKTISGIDPNLQTDLRSVKAQGADVGDIGIDKSGNQFRWTGASWDAQGASGGQTGQVTPTPPSGPSITDILAQQKQEEAQLQQQFQTQVAGQEALPAAYTRLSTQEGIPGLQTQLQGYRTQIANVQGLLNTLEANINERTKGALMNEAQRKRLLAAEQYPLGQELAQLGQAETPIAEQLSTASGNVSTQLQLEQAQQARELIPIQTQLSMFSDRAAREITGYTADRKEKLDIYLNQLSNNQALSLEQMKEASELAKLEREYALKQEEFKTIGKYGGYYRDPTTGQYIYLGGQKSWQKTEDKEQEIPSPIQTQSGGQITNLDQYGFVKDENKKQP